MHDNDEHNQHVHSIGKCQIFIVNVSPFRRGTPSCGRRRMERCRPTRPPRPCARDPSSGLEVGVKFLSSFYAFLTEIV